MIHKRIQHSRFLRSPRLVTTPEYPLPEHFGLTGGAPARACTLGLVENPRPKRNSLIGVSVDVLDACSIISWWTPAALPTAPSPPVERCRILKQCWCGNNAEYDVNGVGVCDMACSGDSSELCGGSYAMSVYENDNVEVDPSYRGCFADTADNRVFHQTTSDFDLTTEVRLVGSVHGCVL